MNRTKYYSRIILFVVMLFATSGCAGMESTICKHIPKQEYERALAKPKALNISDDVWDISVARLSDCANKRNVCILVYSWKTGGSELLEYDTEEEVPDIVLDILNKRQEIIMASVSVTSPNANACLSAVNFYVEAAPWWVESWYFMPDGGTKYFGVNDMNMSARWLRNADSLKDFVRALNKTYETKLNKISD